MTITAIIPAAAQSIPLSRLVRSKTNVRRTGRSRGIEALMASIAAHGLRQNLNVRPTSGGRFEVIAGGRRLEALKRLAKDGVLPADADIPCVLVADDDNAAEISLAENAMREAMHPDDACSAFLSLVEHGVSVDDVAARFGITTTLVRQRLKLASVSPALRQRFRGGELDLSQMMAFALIDDHARQEQVFRDLPEYNRGANAIRRALTADGIAGDHRLVRFVGIEAYEQAGGTILRDLFDDEQPATLTDAALVERLAMTKLEAEAAYLKAEGWSWVTIAIRPDYTTHYGRVYPQAVEGSDEKIYAADDMARAGARVTLDHDGELEIERGLVSQETLKAEQRQAAASTKAQGPKPLPETLVADLTAHRTAALRLGLSERPDLALIATIHALALSQLYVAYGAASCLDLSARSARLVVAHADECAAHDALATRLAAWEAQLPENPRDLWSWCCSQDQSTLLDLLALLAALSLDAVTRKVGGHSAALRHADQLAEVMALDLTQHWTPTAEGFFSRLSKAQMATALREAGVPEQADIVLKLGKAEAAARTAKHLQGTGWLPAPFLPAPAVEDDYDHDDDEDCIADEPEDEA